MNILFLALDVRLDGPYGDSIHVVELARALAARGNSITVVSASVPLSAPSVGGNLTFHARPPGSDWSTLRYCLDAAKHARAGVIYERRLSPKISFSLSHLLGLPFVVEVNGIEEEVAILRPISRRFRLPAKAVLRRWMFHRASRVVAVTDQLARGVSEFYDLDPSRVVSIPNGVDPSLFVPSDSEALRVQLNLLGGPIAMFVGNLVPWQGIEVLLSSVPVILKEFPQARFVILGDGVSRASLEHLSGALGIGAHVTFTGVVPHSEIPSYIAAVDLCLAPFTRQRNETTGVSPLKVYEYMAGARPIVASDVPGIRELLLESDCGLPVTPDDPSALAEAILSVFRHPDDARAMGERGRAFVMRDRTWGRTAERVERTLLEAVRQ